MLYYIWLILLKQIKNLLFLVDFLFLVLCVTLDNEIRNRKSCIKFCTFTQQFLAITCQDTLTWAEALWVKNNWGLRQWYVWAVEISAVHVAVTLIAHQNLTSWEQWVFVHSPAVINRADILDAKAAGEGL